MHIWITYENTWFGPSFKFVNYKDKDEPRVTQNGTNAILNN